MVFAELDVYYLKCQVFDVSVMKVDFIIVLQHIASTIDSMILSLAY